MFVYQKNPVGIELFSHEDFLLFQAICKAADQVSENNI